MNNRPLSGQSILITRAAHQSAPLADRLRELGAEVLIAPAVAIAPPEDWTPVDDALRRLDRYDWLILTSANGVAALAERLSGLGLGPAGIGRLRIAAIGPATADELRRHGLTPTVVPEQYVAEALADALKPLGLTGRRCLLLRSDLARKTLTDELVAAGASCDDIPIYRTVAAPGFPPDVRQRLIAGRIDWVTLTSSSTFTNLVALLGDDAIAALARVKLASIGPITSAAIRAAGYSPGVEATTYTAEGLVDALLCSVGR